MLSSHRRLKERQGQSGTPRHEYLQQLVNEYARTPHRLRKEEIVANLANFAYDPINFPTFHRLDIITLFLDIVRECRSSEAAIHEAKIDAPHLGRAGAAHHVKQDSSSVKLSQQLLLEFAMGGICNCIPDPILQTRFISSGGVHEVMRTVECITLDRFVAKENGDWSTVQSSALEKQQLSEFNTALSALATSYFLLDSAAFEEITAAAFVAHVQRLCGHGNVQIANIACAFVSRQDELINSLADLHQEGLHSTESSAK